MEHCITTGLPDGELFACNRIFSVTSWVPFIFYFCARKKRQAVQKLFELR
jgi:hypothetical protein